MHAVLRMRDVGSMSDANGGGRTASLLKQRASMKQTSRIPAGGRCGFLWAIPDRENPLLRKNEACLFWEISSGFPNLSVGVI